MSTVRLSIAFESHRQIVSGSRDKTIKLWNTLGECKYTIQEDVSAGERGGYARITFRILLLLGLSPRSLSFSWRRIDEGSRCESTSLGCGKCEHCCLTLNTHTRYKLPCVGSCTYLCLKPLTLYLRVCVHAPFLKDGAATAATGFFTINTVALPGFIYRC